MLGIDGKVVMPMGRRNLKSPPPAIIRRKWCCTARTSTTPSLKSAKLSKWKVAFLFRPMTIQSYCRAGHHWSGNLEDLYDVDNVIVPIGGGGLIAGIATAIKSINPTIRIIGVQSENVHGMAASYYAGEITSHRTTGTSRWLRCFSPGKSNFEIVRELVDDIVLVSEDEIRNSMIALIQRNKVITEGAGAWPAPRY
jgi:threonine dehydratase